MRHPLALIGPALLSACATPVQPAPDVPVEVSLGDDCAIIAAVAKEHFQFGPDNPPPPVRFGPGYAPRCDWSRYGLAFTPFDETAARGGARPWVRFDRPRYDGQGALIQVGTLRRDGSREESECRIRSGFAGWTATGCVRTGPG